MERSKKQALLSVSDKTGIEVLARGLVDLGFSVLSTGGTAQALSLSGVGHTSVSDYTGFAEILDGRVKTLHPKIHAGILARDTEEHIEELARIKAGLIDVVAVNLYPFEKTARAHDIPLSELIEQVDIGGPCLLRAAAKNFERVTVVCDPRDYESLLWHLARAGEVPVSKRFELAVKAFSHTAGYDALITRILPEFDVVSGKRLRGVK